MRGRGCLGGWIEAQLAPLAAGQAGGDEAMRFGEISAQLGIAQARPVVVLDPGQPARGKVGRGPEAGLVLQDLEGERADLEGNGGFAAIPLAADGEDLAADRPAEPLGGQGCVSRFSYRGSPDPYNTNK